MATTRKEIRLYGETQTATPPREIRLYSDTPIPISKPVKPISSSELIPPIGSSTQSSTVPIAGGSDAIVDALRGGIGQVKQGAEQLYNARSPLGQLEGIGNIGGGAVGVLTTPFAPLLSQLNPAIEYAANKLSGTKPFQEYGQNPAASENDAPTRIAHAILNASLIAGAGVGAGKIVLSKFAPEALLEKTTFDVPSLRENLRRGTPMPEKVQNAFNILTHEQDKFEPKGTYYASHPSKDIIPELPRGAKSVKLSDIKFENPLIVPFENWKANVSKQFGRLKGEALSKEIGKTYDGIVTVVDGKPHEIVSLTDFYNQAVKERPLLAKENLVLKPSQAKTPQEIGKEVTAIQHPQGLKPFAKEVTYKKQYIGKSELKTILANSKEFKANPILTVNAEKGLEFKDKNVQFEIKPEAMGLNKNNLEIGQKITVDEKALKGKGTLQQLRVYRGGEVFASIASPRSKKTLRKILERTNEAKANEPQEVPKDFKVSDRAKAILKEFGVPTAERGIPNRFLGLFNPLTKKVRVQALYDITTVTHEAIHAIDNQISFSKRLIADTGPGATIRRRLTDIYERDRKS